MFKIYRFVCQSRTVMLPFLQPKAKRLKLIIMNDYLRLTIKIYLKEKPSTDSTLGAMPTGDKNHPNQLDR